MKIIRMRFVDGSQIDFKDVKNIEEGKNSLQFTYIDDSLGSQRVTINIVKSSIIFAIEMKGEN